MPYPGVNPWELTFNSRKRRTRELVEIVNPGKGFASGAKINELLAAEESERAERLYGIDIAPEDTSIFTYNTVDLQKNPPPRNIPSELINKFPLKPPLPILGSEASSTPTLTKKQNLDILTNAIMAIIADKGFTQTGKKLTQYRDAGQRDIPIDFV
jgi:hypothetical protein